MITVDWGTSSLRLYRVSERGVILEQRRADAGILACQGRFAQVLAEQIEGWDDPCIVLCGMIGSRNGWHEMPYVDCPAGMAEMAAAMQRIDDPALPGRALWFLPGLRDATASEAMDVMRGEETQVAALLDTLDTGVHVLCLPGTHSKWVTVQHGRIARVATAVTGEMYAVLKQHSLLGVGMPEGATRLDAYAFDAGLDRSGEQGGLLHHLFGVRTASLFHQFSSTALPSYLSGLLIGHELRASDLFTRSPRPVLVHLIGNDRLLTNYAHALTQLGLGVQRHSEHLASIGAARLMALRQDG